MRESKKKEEIKMYVNNFICYLCGDDIDRGSLMQDKLNEWIDGLKE